MSKIGSQLRDPLTGDIGRVVGYDHENRPIAKTDGGRLFKQGRDVRGFRSLVSQYFDGDLKACNCARCRDVLLGRSHIDQVRHARDMGQDLQGLPPVVAGRFLGRPYCAPCLERVREENL